QHQQQQQQQQHQQQQQQHQQQQHQQQPQQQQTNGSASGIPTSAASAASSATSVAPSQMHPSAYSNGSATSQRYGSNNEYAMGNLQSDDSSNGEYGTAANAANHAANGLFLLSQAHQELTKREEAAQKQSLASGPTGSTTGPALDQDPSAAANGASSAKRGLDDDDVSDDEGGQHSMQSPTSSKGGQKKFETEEEKRRNFLERNRQAALKCRQRKKAWLTQLQAKVEFLSNENERLTNALVSSREEIARLSQLVGGAGVGLPLTATGMSVGVGVPINGIGIGGVQQQQQQQQQQAHGVHHAPYIVHQPHHPVSVPVNLQQGGTASSPPMANKNTPLQQHQQPPQQQSPHSPTSEGRSSRSSVHDARDYAGGGRDASNGRDYVREREMNGHMHSHAPQAVAVNGRGYGY
ncbi:hypothetical protein EW145_g8242, partial [Phellinidium pouzarii]